MFVALAGSLSVAKPAWSVGTPVQGREGDVGDHPLRANVDPGEGRHLGCSGAESGLQMSVEIGTREQLMEDLTIAVGAGEPVQFLVIFRLGGFDAFTERFGDGAIDALVGFRSLPACRRQPARRGSTTGQGGTRSAV